MTLKSIIIALLVTCASLFAETPASVFADSLDQGKSVVDSSVTRADSLADSARVEKESPVAEPDEESEDEVAMDEPPEVDFETTTILYDRYLPDQNTAGKQHHDGMSMFQAHLQSCTCRF